MSLLRVVTQGELEMLDLIFAVDMNLHLFRTDVETGLTESQREQLDETDFTEANFAGYAAAPLTGGSWTTNVGDPSIARYAQQTFTRSSTGTAQLIYGYYVTLDSSGALLWYEQFDGPISIQFINDAVRVTPKLDASEGGEVPTGQITAFGGASAPTGWLLCDGSAVSRTTFAALFAAIGTAFGAGNGTTTFNVPDLRQRFPMGKAAAGTGSTLGGTGGTIDHTHGLDTSTSHARVTTTSGLAAFDRKNINWTDDTTMTATGGASNITAVARTTATALGGDTATANAPFQAVNFIVKT